MCEPCSTDDVVLSFGLGIPFYRSRGGSRLQNISTRVGLDRGIARVNLRLPTSVPSTGLVVAYLAMMVRASP